MADLTPEQQKEYDERLASYTPTGSYANQSIVGFRKYVKNGELDVEGAMKAEGLNERQIPFLQAELLAAGFVKASGNVAAEVAVADPLPDGFPHKEELEAGGVASLKQIDSMPDDALLSIPNIGPSRLQDIREARRELNQ